MTNGMKTSEFWIAQLTTVAAAAAHYYLGVAPETIATIVAPTFAYIVSRGVAKIGKK